MSIVDELVTLLGFDLAPGAEGNAKKYDAALVGLVKGAAAVGAALVTASAGVVAFARTQITAIDEGAEFAETIGLTYERFQELAFAANLTGGSIQDLQSDMLRIAAIVGGPVDEALIKLAKQMEGLDKSKQIEMAKKLRLSPGTLRLLQSGADGIEDLARQSRELGLIVSGDVAKGAAQFNDQMDILGGVVGAAGSKIAASLLPAMRKAVDATLAWFKANAKILDSGIGQILDGVGMGFEMVGDGVSWVVDQVRGLLPDLDALTEGLDVTRVIAVAVAGALTLIAGALIYAAAPLVAAGAAVAAFLILLEDLYTWLIGGESVIGGWADQFAKAFPEIAALIGEVVDLVGGLMTLLGPAALVVLKAFGAVIKGVFDGVVFAIKTALGLVDKFVGLVRGVGGAIGSVVGAITQPGQLYRTPISANVPASTVAGVASMGGNTSAVINVNGAGDPRAVADAVVGKAGLGRAVQQSTPGRTGPGVG